MIIISHTGLKKIINFLHALVQIKFLLHMPSTSLPPPLTMRVFFFSTLQIKHQKFILFSYIVKIMTTSKFYIWVVFVVY